MLELLSKFTLDKIVVYTVMLLFAVKGFADLYCWFRGKYGEKFKKDYIKATKEQQIKMQHQNIEAKINMMAEQINRIETQVNQLIESDMHDIKSWIVEKHHFLKKQGFVDDFTMDVIEKRFSDYVKENGNSYIKGLVGDIRKLPHARKKED